MTATVTRRTFLTTGAATAGVLLPGVGAYARRHPTHGVRFRLNAEVLDGGEQVVSITLHTAHLGAIDPASLTTGTFRVHAKATSPIPVAADDQIFSEYDLDRPVTGARLDRRGNIVLDLSYAEGQVGGGTLGYIVGKGRNVVLDLVYTITQNAPIVLRNGRSITIARFVQGRLSDPEVDAFSYHVSGSGMNYRLYSPGRGHRSHDGQAPARRLAARRRRGRLAARSLLRQRDAAAGQPRCAGLRHPGGTADLRRRLCRGPAEHLVLDRGRTPLRPAHPRDHRRSRPPVPDRPRADLRGRLQQRRLHDAWR